MDTLANEKVLDEAILPKDADYALLQEPLNIGVKNVRQILNCVQSGSKEIKDLVLNECNVIYECKVCQNLFRSLANFLYHKRCFCKKHLCEGMLLFEHFEEPQVAQAHTELVLDEQKETDLPSSKNDLEEVVKENSPPTAIIQEEAHVSTNSDEPLKSEEQVLDEVPNKEVQELEDKTSENITVEKDDIPQSETITKASVTPVKIMGHLLKFTMKERVIEGCKNVKVRLLRNEKEENPSIVLKPIEGNKHVVFQESNIKREKVLPDVATAHTKVTSSEEDDCIEVEASSDNDKEAKVKKLPTSKAPVKREKDIHLSRRKRLLNRTDCLVPSLTCLKCVTQFTTLKTLYFHMMSLHSQKRLYYPCPFCKTLFVQMYGVTRHIISVHNKTKEHIDNKLREAIRKSAIWKRVDENTLKKEEKELCEKENSDVEVVSPVKEEKISDDLPSASNDKTFHSYVKLDNVNLALHQCSKCSRVFGRKSSQVSHQKFCIMNSSPKSDSEAPLSVPPIKDTYSDVKTDLSAVTKRLSFSEGKANTRPKRGAEKRMHKDFVDSQTLKWRSANKIETASKFSAMKPDNKTAFKQFERKIKTIVNAEKLLCLKCSRKFSSFSNLRRHAAIHIGWTRYECKTCNYQSYNKSDCRHHIERIHNVPEADIEKSIIHLVTDVSKAKISNNKKVTTTKGKKKNFGVSKTKILNKQKKTKRKTSSSSSVNSTPNKDRNNISNSPNKDSNVPISPTKDRVMSVSHKVRNHLKREMVNNHLPEVKKQKKSRIITLIKQPPIKKTQGNYKSVTTNNPTTIILSKTGPNSSMQELKNAARNAQKINKSPESSIIHKTYEVKFMTETISKPTVDPRNSIFPSRIFSSATTPIKTDLTKIGNGLPTSDKSEIKKNRNISDWLIKKDKPANMDFASPVKRESAPVIIGLVPAQNSVSRIKIVQNNKSPEKH